MITHSHLKTKGALFSPPRPIEEYPKDSIQKMAVLFTDIVGSSVFFKTRGDIAGRKMLRKHQDMVSPVIKKYSGVVVKILGDSVMAYFLDPREALKSAITIQQKFKRFNNQREPREQIHIRICIHFGDGIVEEKDIFGDVVNMAAKFLPLVDGDQIFLSQEVHDKVKDLRSTHFAPVTIPQKKRALIGLNIYRVIWDEAVTLDPLMKTLIYFKPVWGLGKNNFSNVWDNLLGKRKSLWNFGNISKERILSDKSVALIVKDAASSLTFAKNVTEFLRLNLGKNGTRFLPVQIIIDSGPYLRGDRLTMEDLDVDWAEIEPGEIYVSQPIFKNLKNNGAFSLITPADTSKPHSFFKLNIKNNRSSDTHLFLYQDALIDGDNRPCFYCGDRKHLTAKCPSKQLTDFTHALNRLGYLPIDEINNIFFNYLNDSASYRDQRSAPGIEIKEDGTQPLAHHGFFELKAVYQLRFLRNLWNIREENWNKIKEIKNDRDKGGLLWIGLDCIRVSNMEQAESILSDSLQKEPKDYRAYCAMGFLKIERNDFQGAKAFLKKALDLAMTSPQKIFILFLISRLYYLNNVPLRTREMIRKILRLSPFCPEALYQDILFKFQKVDKAVALHQLIKLIKINRDYYVISLIDPELADFCDMIHPKLEHLLIEAREEAHRIIPEAKEELARFEKLMGKEEKAVSEARSLFAKMEELSSIDCYFGYLDIIHYGSTIIKISQRSIEGRELRLSKILMALRRRLKECLIRINRTPSQYLTESLSNQIGLLQKKIDKNWEMTESSGPDTFQKALKALEKISIDLGKIEQKLERIENLAHALQYAAGFFKKSLIFQSINLIIALILFPIMTHYLNFLLPDLRISPQNIWQYQKIFLILGGLSGLFLAALMTKTDPQKN